MSSIVVFRESFYCQINENPATSNAQLLKGSNLQNQYIMEN